MAAEFVQQIGERISERRKELGLTQLELALSLPGKVGADQVSRWERGIHKPEDDTLEEIAAVLKVPVAHFLVTGPDKDGPTPSLFDSDYASVAARDMVTAMFESIEQRVLAQLAEHAREVEAQLTGQSETLAEMKQTLADIREGIMQEQRARKSAEDARREAEAAAKELRGLLDVLAALPAFASDPPPKPAARAKRAK